jgi:hypothetical protein
MGVEITALPSLTSADIDSAVDVLAIVDVTGDVTGKITVTEVLKAGNSTGLKLTAAMDTTLRNVTDNASTPAASKLYLATDKTAITATLKVGSTAAAAATLDVLGSGTTSGTTSLIVANSNAQNLLSLSDNGAAVLGFSGQGGYWVAYPQIFFANACYNTLIAPVSAGVSYLPFSDYNSAENIMRMYQNADRALRISDNNVFTANASGILELNSTTKGVIFPRLTTTQKNAITSPIGGMVIYDSTLAKLCVYTTAWETITSA